MICKKTCKGKVVYARRRHYFNLKDAVRVNKSVAEVRKVTFVDAQADDILSFIASGLVYTSPEPVIEEPPADEESSSEAKEFGGAGTSGDFEAPLAFFFYNRRRIEED